MPTGPGEGLLQLDVPQCPLVVGSQRSLWGPFSEGAPPVPESFLLMTSSPPQGPTS